MKLYEINIYTGCYSDILANYKAFKSEFSRICYGSATFRQWICCADTWPFPSERSVDTVAHERKHLSVMGSRYEPSPAHSCFRQAALVHSWPRPLKAGYEQAQIETPMGKWSINGRVFLSPIVEILISSATSSPLEPWRHERCLIFRKKHFLYQFCAPWLIEHWTLPWDERVVRQTPMPKRWPRPREFGFLDASRRWYRGELQQVRHVQNPCWLMISWRI